jgi:hypothetical protein
MDWKTPFEIAFKLGMAAVGWALVLIIVFLIFAISYAAVTTIASSWRKKKNPQEIKKTILKVVNKSE